ncbi:AdoMet-homocysteine methyltransferase [Orbilia oligospora]|uniref:AdoMet-homocysteine methyltransferase n=1 Tax=Orbilia oligospora TaxID=2813651 RepID=A0A6G1M3C1_ORBOL|nr:AdoMet-homocysteine methyltransferase [Orbilia oligospora]KAF3220513.1 AdoMet-homocysteine methyltransferase [Orbilia oligospora]KAF3244074.1 AdoMet-homocysteine methyltransferase [Orbilia oligospora]
MSTPIIILDGALGTLLCDTTSPEASASPLWSSIDLLHNPSRLADVHAQYIKAGAGCIETATYQLCRETLLRSGVSDEDQMRKICHAAMQLAVDATKDLKPTGNNNNNNASVALSLGPYGMCLHPSQEYSGVYPPPYNTDSADAVNSLEKWHRDRLQEFQKASHDAFEQMYILAFETVPYKRVDEISAIRRVIDSEEFKGRKAWISMVYTEVPSERVIGRVTRKVFEDIPLGSAQRGIGINCTKLENVREIVRVYSKTITDMRLRKEGVFLVLYPDGGLTYDVNTKTWSDENGMAEVEKWCKLLQEIVEEAVNVGCWGSIIIGGCCKTTPEHISELSRTFAAIQ